VSIFYEHGAHRCRNRSSKHRFGLKLWTLLWNCSFFSPVCLFAVMRNYGIKNKNMTFTCTINSSVWAAFVVCCKDKFSVILQELIQRPHIAIAWEMKFRLTEVRRHSAHECMRIQRIGRWGLATYGTQYIYLDNRSVQMSATRFSEQAT